MKVLDINANCCWSLQAPDQDTIARLRAAVEIQDSELRKRVLEDIKGKAFGFVGDPAKLDFAAGFFDEVNLNFKPDDHQGVLLRQCARRWCKAKLFFEDHEVPSEWGNQRSGWKRLLDVLTPKFATS